MYYLRWRRRWRRITQRRFSNRRVWRICGGGAGGGTGPNAGGAGTAGTDGLGGGGGGGGSAAVGTQRKDGGDGGDGIVIIRAPADKTLTVSPGTNSTSTHPAGCKLATFTVTGCLTIS